MKEKKVIIFLVFFVLASLSLVFLNESKNHENLDKVFIDSNRILNEENLNLAFLDSTEILLEIVETKEELVLGLSGRHSIAAADGMLFVFSEEDEHGIWMKEMLFSIDIIWINSLGEVVFIEENVSPDTFPNILKPNKSAKYVLEVPSGTVKKEDWVVGSSLVLQ
jgi:uncharacterized membrane protein (UPF0127 family)